MVICLERGADLHMAQLMPLPLTVSCSSKVQIGFTFLVQAHPGSPGKRAVKQVCVCVCVWHQLDHMQTICTSLPTNNHTDTSSLNFYRPDTVPDAQPTVSEQRSLERTTVDGRNRYLVINEVEVKRAEPVVSWTHDASFDGC